MLLALALNEKRERCMRMETMLFDYPPPANTKQIGTTALSLRT